MMYPEEDQANDGVYSEEGRQELIEDEDEITAIDEGFMKGYEEGERAAECANCGKVLYDDFVEEELSGEMYRFCTSHCAEEFTEKQLSS